MKARDKKGENLEKVTILGMITWVLHFIARAFLYSVFVIFLCIVGVFITYFADQLINVRRQEAPLLYAYVIVSPSMVPAINVNDAILVKRREPHEVEVGSIITYLSTDPRYYGFTVTHRVVQIQTMDDGRKAFTTKGDNNNTIDATYVTEDNLIGEVIFRLPGVGHLQRFLLNIWGWILLIIVPSVSIVVYDVVKLLKANKKDDFQKKRQFPTEEETIELIGKHLEEVHDYPEKTEILDLSGVKGKEIKEEDIEIL